MNQCYFFIVAVALISGCTGNETTTESAPEQSTVSENERFDNPVDKKTYIAEGGWKTYEPNEAQTPEETGRIHTAGIRLLTAQHDIAKRTSVESLAAFAELAEASAQETLMEVSTRATVLTQFTCTPGEHSVQLSHRGSVTQDQLQAYYDALLALDSMPVSSDEVSFQLTIEIEPVTAK